MPKKLSVEHALAKRIWEAWGFSDEVAVVVTKRHAVTAARVALNRDPKTGKGDALWDALVEAIDLHPDQITKNKRGRMNNALTQLREVGATPEQIISKAKSFRYHHPEWELTEQSLVTHWAGLRVSGDTQRPVVQEREPEPELVPPPPGFWDAVSKVTRPVE